MACADNANGDLAAIGDHHGLGTIGKKAARLGRAFGMNVHYYDIMRVTEDAEAQLGVRFRLLDEILNTSDL